MDDGMDDHSTWEIVIKDDEPRIEPPPADTRVALYVNSAHGTFYPLDGDPRWHSRFIPGSIGWRDAIEQGMYERGGVPLAEPERTRIQNRLLGLAHQGPPIFDPTSEEAAMRPYVPGLMSHGTVPALIGPKGWGKTRFLSPFAAALVTPGRRFLGYFEPAEMTEEERERDVWLINPETHPGAVHARLLESGLTFGYRRGVPCYFPDPEGRGEPAPGQGVLIVEHLRKTTGGPSSFDLTNADRRAYWAIRLLDLTGHRAPPLTLIVDGVTAILRNGARRYSEFSSAFREMLEEVGIPNGLGALHSPMGVGTDTPMFGVESMAEWDGQWYARASAFPIEPATPRYWRTIPRDGDPVVPERRIIVGSDGMLALVDLEGKKATAAPAAPDPDSEPAADLGGGDDPLREAKETIRTRLRDAEPERLWTKDVCATGDDYTKSKAALLELERDGEVTSGFAQVGRSRGYMWGLTANEVREE